MLQRPEWAGFNDSDLEIFRLKLSERYGILRSYCHWNLIKIQQTVLEGKLSYAKSSHLGQVHRLLYVSMKECS